MGRTNPTFRDMLGAIEERWSDYRRGLRRRDQSLYDRLFEYAHDHADASGLLNPQHPILPIFFSIDLEQQAQLDEQKKRLERLENKIQELETDE